MATLGKKIFKSLILFPFLILISTSTVAAKSGCCSGHGGVSCAAGPQSNGHVICNDGWRGSSCFYSGMVMCGGTSTSNNTINTAPMPTPSYKPTPTSLPSPKPSPKPSPLNSPSLSPSSTPSPSPSPTPSPTPMATPTLISEPSVSSEVKGTTTESNTTSNSDGLVAVIGFGSLGLVGGGFYWLVKKLLS